MHTTTHRNSIATLLTCVGLTASIAGCATPTGMVRAEERAQQRAAEQAQKQQEQQQALKVSTQAPAAEQFTPAPTVASNTGTPTTTEVAYAETVDDAIATEQDFFDEQRESFSPSFTGSRPGLFGEIAGRSQPADNAQMQPATDPSDVLRVTFSSVGADFDPQVSANGRQVIFASTRHRETADIYVKPIDGRAVRQITNDPSNDVMPSLSPDGRRIAYASDRLGNWDIYVADIAGGQPLQITSDFAHDLHPSWSPDGTRLIFSRLNETSGRWELWLVDVNNPMVISHVGYGLFPEWCPVPNTGEAGGDRIVYQRARERGSRLFSVWSCEISGDEVGYLTELAASPGTALINPTWSRDGERVAFASVELETAIDNGDNGFTPTAADVWFMNVDGTGLTNLTADAAVNLMPTWGEGNSVFFISDRAGSDNIWSLNADRAVVAAGGPSLQGTTRTVRNTPAQNNAAPSEETFATFPADENE